MPFTRTLGTVCKNGVRMRALMKFVDRLGLRRCERGATAVEYALMLGLIVLGVLVALTNVATKTTGMWNNVSTEVLAH